MNRTTFSAAIICLLAVLFSCSGTSNTTQQSGTASDIQKYPSWYPNRSVVDTDSMMYAYATAIADDSASSVSKAVAWAEEELKSSLSNKLENIRSDAVTDLGSDSGLDSSRFIFALRKAENAVSNLITTGKTEVKTVEGYHSYRIFAEVMVPKDKLIARIGQRLGGYEKAWTAMKESRAFQDF